MTIRTCLLVGAAMIALLPGAAAAQETKISGRVFYDVTDNADGVGFDLERFYVALDHRFNEVLSANLTTDLQYSSRTGESDFFVKKAYLQAKPSDALTLRVGAADLPWISYVDGFYGYRWIEKTLIDRTDFGNSSDWGVHALGEFKDGAVSYAISAVDGGGHRDPSKSTSVDLEGRIGAKLSDLHFGVGGYSGKRGQDVPGTPALRTARRLNAALAYTPKSYRIGLEVFAAENWENVITLLPDRSRGYSVFGSHTLNDKLSLFARHDRVRPTRITDPSRDERHFNVGAAYSPVRNVDFAVVYKRETVETAGARRQTSNEVGLWGQLRF
jgi:hypothetical protein